MKHCEDKTSQVQMMNLFLKIIIVKYMESITVGGRLMNGHGIVRGSCSQAFILKFIFLLMIRLSRNIFYD